MLSVVETSHPIKKEETIRHASRLRMTEKEVDSVGEGLARAIARETIERVKRAVGVI